MKTCDKCGAADLSDVEESDTRTAIGRDLAAVLIRWQKHGAGEHVIAAALDDLLGDATADLADAIKTKARTGEELTCPGT